MSTQQNVRQATGATGEDIAVAWLEQQGWRILARNWRCRAGELDIIALDPAQVVVVCEVKTRRGLGYGDPLEALTYAKVRRLRQLTAEWAHSQPERIARVRIDAIGILLAGDGTATVRHVRDVEQT